MARGYGVSVTGVSAYNLHRYCTCQHRGVRTAGRSRRVQKHDTHDTPLTGPSACAARTKASANYSRKGWYSVTARTTAADGRKSTARRGNDARAAVEPLRVFASQVFCLYSFVSPVATAFLAMP